MTQRMGHFVGQAKPQRMGTPYYPSLSLLPLPVRIWSPSSVSHQRTRASAAGVVAGSVDEMMTGLSIIEGVDLDAEIPCETRDHDHPADLRIARTCGMCPNFTRAVCRPSHETMLRLMAEGDVCRTCKRPVSVRIIEVLR